MRLEDAIAAFEELAKNEGAPSAYEDDIKTLREGLNLKAIAEAGEKMLAASGAPRRRCPNEDYYGRHKFCAKGSERCPYIEPEFAADHSGALHMTEDAFMVCWYRHVTEGES